MCFLTVSRFRRPISWILLHMTVPQRCQHLANCTQLMILKKVLDEQKSRWLSQWRLVTRPLGGCDFANSSHAPTWRHWSPVIVNSGTMTSLSHKLCGDLLHRDPFWNQEINGRKREWRRDRIAAQFSTISLPQMSFQENPGWGEVIRPLLVLGTNSFFPGIHWIRGIKYWMPFLQNAHESPSRLSSFIIVGSRTPPWHCTKCHISLQCHLH